MTAERRRLRAAALAVLAVLLLAGQPLGVLAHVVHDHLGDHEHAAHDDVAFHGDGVHAPEHDGDHAHVWVTPAGAARLPRLGQPQPIATAAPFDLLPIDSATPAPPSAPPRA